MKINIEKVKFGTPVDPLCPPFLYYWSDLTEIFTQHVKLKKKHFLFIKIFPFRVYFFIYIQIYIYK